MSQADQVVQNASHIAVRVDINEQIKALVTLAAGSTAPAVTEQFMLWADTTLRIMRQRDIGNANFNKTLWSLDDVLVVLSTTNQSLSLKDIRKLHLGNATAGVITYTLPNLTEFACCVENYFITFKKVDSSGNAVIIDGFGSDTVEGNPNFSLNVENDSVSLRPDGNNWHVVSNFSPGNPPTMPLVIYDIWRANDPNCSKGTRPLTPAVLIATIVLSRDFRLLPNCILNCFN